MKNYNQNFQKVSLQFYRQNTEGREVLSTETAFFHMAHPLEPKGEPRGLGVLWGHTVQDLALGHARACRLHAFLTWFQVSFSTLAI